jgi:protein TonB
MVAADYIASELDDRWLKYFLLSGLANLLIISMFTVGAPVLSPQEIPMLKVNLMALAAPKAHPKIEPKKPAESQSVEKVETQKYAPKKIVQQKTPVKREAAVTKTTNVMEQKQTPQKIEKPSQAKPNHNRGKQKSSVIHEAQYRRQAAPIYPRRSLELGQEGIVTLHAKIHPNGLPQSLKIAKSSGYRLLDMAALAAVKKWEFEPTNVNGSAISSWVRVPVRFVIQ